MGGPRGSLNSADRRRTDLLTHSGLKIPRSPIARDAKVSNSEPTNRKHFVLRDLETSRQRQTTCATTRQPSCFLFERPNKDAVESYNPSKIHRDCHPSVSWRRVCGHLHRAAYGRAGRRGLRRGMCMLLRPHRVNYRNVSRRVVPSCHSFGATRLESSKASSRRGERTAGIWTSIQRGDDASRSPLRWHDRLSARWNADGKPNGVTEVVICGRGQ